VPPGGNDRRVEADTASFGNPAGERERFEEKTPQRNV
jgi:hypothetical protein